MGPRDGRMYHQLAQLPNLLTSRHSGLGWRGYLLVGRHKYHFGYPSKTSLAG